MVIEFNTENLKFEDPTKLDPSQQKIMDMFIPILEKYLPKISPYVLRGMFRLSIKEYYNKTGISTQKLMIQSITEAKDGIRQIFDIMNIKLSKILRRQTDKNILDAAINSAYDLVIEMRSKNENNIK